VRRLNLGQRIIAVTGLGAGLWFLGQWITTIGSTGIFGWVAYAPLSRATNPPEPVMAHAWVRLLVWLGLTIVWVAASMWLLRSQKRDADTSG
jgi:hypothetical protein